MPQPPRRPHPRTAARARTADHRSPAAMARTIRTLQTENATLREAIQVRNDRESGQLEEIDRLQRVNADVPRLRTQLHGLQAQVERPYRVLRLVEYAGPRDLVERQVRQSIHGTVEALGGVRPGASLLITAVTLHEYPEVLKIARSAPSVRVDTSDAQDAELPENGQRRG